jgi:DNA-directed RNA polymerase specialized sigma24 family protein
MPCFEESPVDSRGHNGGQWATKIGTEPVRLYRGLRLSEFENHSENSAHTDDMASVSCSQSPVTMWLRKLEAGDPNSAGAIYQHFCIRLQNLINRQIPASVRATYDADDVTVSAFHSLFMGVREQRYQLGNRTDIWRLLLTIAERKIAKRIRFETQEKRDIRRLLQNSIFVSLHPGPQQNNLSGVNSLPGYEPTPAFAAEVAETCENLLGALPDDCCRTIALLMLENYTAEQVAKKLGCTRRTVQRKLLVIRRTWQDSSGTDFPVE